MMSTLNAMVAKEHTAQLIAQADRWRFAQTARALLRARSQRPSPSRTEAVPTAPPDLLDAVADVAYCQRAAAPARQVAA